MEKKYILEGLDCPNCALKIEKNLNKNEYVKEATVNAATLLCVIDYKEFNEIIEKEIIHLIEDLEDVHVISKDKHHHSHEHHDHDCVCGHHHEHEHHDHDCGCGHHHEHEHHDHDCGCGHHHEHEHHDHDCGCGHHHEHEHHDHDCGCGHHHEHEHHDHDCGCGHHHEHEHHDHDCGCGHHHEHEHHEHKEMPTDKDLVKVKWTIDGLDCAHCALKVEDAVNNVKEVEYATLNFTTKTLLFYVKKNVDLKHVKEDVRKTILDLEDVDITEENEVKENKKNHKLSILPLGVIIFIAGLLLKNDLIVIVSYFMIGFKVILKAIKNIKRGEIFDENFLMLIATIGALIVGEYLEAVAVMLFYQIGEYFQDRAVDKSRKSIADLMNIKSDIAHHNVNGEWEDVDPESIHVGEIILIQPGERIPLDGIIAKGNSMIDTSALTGESLPREVNVHDSVMAGCINLNGVIEVKVSHELSESTVSRILDMVENASSKKAKTELKMTRFARVYTPIVVISAVLLAIVPNFFNTGISWQEWLIRACTFLVISCPCALVLSIPLGYFAGIGNASKKGILVKGGNYLEILSEVDTIVFDKTGTLTNGTFKVTNIHSNNKEECLKLAAMAESYSTHPIALSILNEYGKHVHKDEIENVEEIAGHGIKAVIDNKVVLVGNIKLMNDYEIEYPTIESTGTLVYVAYDNRYIGTIEINDTLKETTIESLKQLKDKGIQRLVMLTGDRKETAMKIANECGITEVYYDLLPTDKVNQFESILATSKNKVAYVGDGINDAPVLARSDLGIAMGGLGSEAAIEASDLVLMKDDLSQLSKGIELARFTQKIMNQNIVFILLIKAIILLLSINGYANMWLGVFADVGVSLIAVLNSMRVLRK